MFSVLSTTFAGRNSAEKPVHINSEDVGKKLHLDFFDPDTFYDIKFRLVEPGNEWVKAHAELGYDVGNKNVLLELLTGTKEVHDGGNLVFCGEQKTLPVHIPGQPRVFVFRNKKDVIHVMFVAG